MVVFGVKEVGLFGFGFGFVWVFGDVFFFFVDFVVGVLGFEFIMEFLMFGVGVVVIFEFVGLKGGWDGEGFWGRGDEWDDWGRWGGYWWFGGMVG